MLVLHWAVTLYLMSTVPVIHIIPLTCYIARNMFTCLVPTAGLNQKINFLNLSTKPLKTLYHSHETATWFKSSKILNLIPFKLHFHKTLSITTFAYRPIGDACA